MIDTEKYLKWLNQNYTMSSECPVCGETGWLVESELFGLPEFKTGTLTLDDGSVFPVLVATCHRCGFVQLINAVIAGFIEKPLPE